MSFFDSEEMANSLFNLQGSFRKYLYLIIISNFILIFALKFQIKLKTKFAAMFDIKDEKPESISKARTVLFLTAHPDDEIMFLSPTLKKLTSLNFKTKILCLSNGNYDGIGKLREEEFNTVSKSLHMEDNQIIDHPKLQDNITSLWDYNLVAEQIKKYLDNNQDIGTIITFDEYGVTKHPNHISVYFGLETLIKQNRKEFKERKINVYLFDSFSPLTQYTFIWPFFNLYFKEFSIFDYSFSFSWKHMVLYKSQFNIPRRFHVVFSGYTYCNSFTKVEIQ